jgi:DNA-directed RNA polymerase subunit RPC12/RpoP
MRTDEEHLSTQLCDNTETTGSRDSDMSQQTNSLNRHTQVLAGEKQFRCEFCGKGFSRPSHLERHSRIHTGDKPYPCLYCSSRFSDASVLRRHLQCHTGEKPFACQFCDKRFSQTRALIVHTRTHTGDRPYSCQQCGKKFFESYTLARHTQSHVCDDRYTNRETGKKLNVADDETETGEWLPYASENCNTGFREEDYLAEHAVIHSCERLDPDGNGSGGNGLITHCVADGMRKSCDEGIVPCEKHAVDIRCLRGKPRYRLTSSGRSACDLSALKIKRPGDDAKGGEFCRSSVSCDIKEASGNIGFTDSVLPAIVKEENLRFDERCLMRIPQTDWKLMVAPVVELVRVDTC